MFADNDRTQEVRDLAGSKETMKSVLFDQHVGIGSPGFNAIQAVARIL